MICETIKDILGYSDCEEVVNKIKVKNKGRT